MKNSIDVSPSAFTTRLIAETLWVERSDSSDFVLIEWPVVKHQIIDGDAGVVVIVVPGVVLPDHKPSVVFIDLLPSRKLLLPSHLHSILVTNHLARCDVIHQRNVNLNISGVVIGGVFTLTSPVIKDKSEK